MQNKKLLLIGIALLPCIINGSQEKDSIVDVYSCKGENVQCDYNLVSPNTPFNYDITGLDIIPLGILNGDLITTIKFPQIEEKVLYSFVPTSGPDLGRGKTISLMIVSFDIHNIRPEKVFGTKFFGTTNYKFDVITKEAAHATKQFKSWVNYMYKIYRQFKEDQQWTEVATIFSQKPITSQMIKLKKDGAMLIANKKEGQEEVLKSEKLGAFMTIYVSQF